MPKKTKFEKVFKRYEKVNPKYYEIALEYKSRLSKHITELALNDRVYSDYIKITKSENGWCTCITSGIKRRWSDPMMQNGHFHLRKDYKYRFMDDNCRPQSRESNVANNGDYVRYTRFIANKLFNGDRIKAEAMFEDDERVVVSKTEQIDLVVNKWYPKIKELKEKYGSKPNY